MVAASGVDQEMIVQLIYSEGKVDLYVFDSFFIF